LSNKNVKNIFLDVVPRMNYHGLKFKKFYRLNTKQVFFTAIMMLYTETVARNTSTSLELTAISPIFTAIPIVFV